MTSQSCTATVCGEKCGAALIYRETIRGGEIELYTCTSPHAHKRHINRAGRQYSTHPDGPKKAQIKIHAYQWQVDAVLATGRTKQEFWDINCAKLLDTNGK